MTPEDWDRLGRLVDRLENGLAARKLPGVPLHIHLTGLAGIVEAVTADLKAFVVEKSGETPWEDHPDD